MMHGPFHSMSSAAFQALMSAAALVQEASMPIIQRCHLAPIIVIGAMFRLALLRIPIFRGSALAVRRPLPPHHRHPQHRLHYHHHRSPHHPQHQHHPRGMTIGSWLRLRINASVLLMPHLFPTPPPSQHAIVCTVKQICNGHSGTNKSYSTARRCGHIVLKCRGAAAHRKVCRLSCTFVTLHEIKTGKSIPHSLTAFA